MSYRKACEKLNRVRGQEENGTPARTLANIVEIEGKKIQDEIETKSFDILLRNKFNLDGQPRETDMEKYGIDAEKSAIDADIIKNTIEEYNKGVPEELKIDETEADKYYENPDNTVNISIDDVGVKEQKESGRSNQKVRKDHSKYVENSIVHVEKGSCSYILNWNSIKGIIPILIAFLIRNSLLNDRLEFFVDGARSLQNAIVEGFSWFRSYGIILDWYHLKEKCEMELSLALKGIKIRNSILDNILPYLWIGKIDKAIEILNSINDGMIKSKANIDKLIGYFERNRGNIPCYALRKKLGLRNSSNKGEKANDLVVSDR